MPEGAWDIVKVGGAVGVLFLWVSSFIVGISWTKYQVNELVKGYQSRIDRDKEIMDKLAEPLKDLAGAISNLAANQDRTMDLQERLQSSFDRMNDALNLRKP